MAAHRIVFANEKGGSGKSTSAVHVAVALAAMGRNVAAIDLDTRQRTLGRYLDNRAATIQREGLSLPMPTYETFDPAKGASIESRLEAMAEGVDFLVVDTPGRDDEHVRAAIVSADTLVTPINDSFVDLDLIGQVDADTFKVRRPSFYAELVWDARKARGKRDGATVDWVVLRNRLQHLEARNMKRVAAALAELSKRVGFRVIPGLSERVIYRELFPKGLTLLDLAAIGADAGLGHLAARGELRELVAAMQLPAAAAAATARQEEPA
jgi:chromosome partitioning protein